MRVLNLLLLAALFLSVLPGCPDNPIADTPLKEPESRTYHDDYDNVWRAIQLAMRKYPVHLNNIESGILETDYIKGDTLFSDPTPEHQKPGMRYKITIRAVKGAEDKKSAVKVTVVRSGEVQPDFFTGYKTVESYGLEERVILYRIRRYLHMDKLLSKSNQSENQK